MDSQLFARNSLRRSTASMPAYSVMGTCPLPLKYSLAAASPAVATKAPARKAERAWVKTLLGASVTVVFEATCGGHVLEIMKIVKQVSNDPYPVILRNMVKEKGIPGLLDGFLPWGAMQSLVKGAVFGWGQAFSYSLLEGNSFMSPEATMVLSGGCGGAAQGVIMSPMLLLKTRVMTDPRFRTTGGVVETTVASSKLGADIIRKEGVAVMCKGMGVFTIKRFADWTTRFLFVELVQSVVRGDEKRPLGTYEKMACALAGGTLSALATVPIDVMVATVQDAGKSGQSVSVVKVFANKFKEGGLGGTIQLATRGLVARVTHVALTTLMMKTITSALYDRFFREQD